MSYQRAMMENFNYWNDPRTIAKMTAKPALSPDNEYLIYPVGEDEETEEPVVVRVRTQMAVCPICQGKGRHVNPSIDAGGLTEEDYELWPPEDIEAYWNGDFDVTCYECKGRNVVPVPNWASVTPEERKLVEDWEREERDYAALCAMERRMGC